MGDQSTTTDHPHYMYAPLRVNPVVELLAGIAATVAPPIAVLLLVRASVTGRLARGWWMVIAAITTATTLVGYTYRVVTAGVDPEGVDITAGILLLYCYVLIPALLLTAVVAAVRLLRSPRRSG